MYIDTVGVLCSYKIKYSLSLNNCHSHRKDKPNKNIHKTTAISPRNHQNNLVIKES